ncbi:MAG: transketolase [Parcubacteria group bacterium CG10_big_fil_rev_8_21_14_0_10_38_31]|nr:MAG: transketolase [Parcubacteria group bacterium CG10_big_fil_rev_8_21_14_0_10_38_31]
MKELDLYSFLTKKAKEIRRKTFEMVVRVGKGHLGGSFSVLEMLVALYYGGVLKFDPKNPKWDGRDIFILSKGHASNSLCVVLSDLGFFPEAELDNFSRNESILGQHSDTNIPGVEINTGSLGHGIGVGSGIAFGNKLDNKNNLIFVILGDGECQEGSVWEAAMFAGHHNLNNLVAIVDRNKLGSEDFTENTSRLEPFLGKWNDFGWEVKTINDGHSFPEIFEVLKNCRDPKRTKPLMIISNTIKGKGLSCLENFPRAHHTVPRGEEIEASRKELS